MPIYIGFGEDISKFLKGMKSYVHAFSHILFATVPISRKKADGSYA
jgi:hypothetical protein